MKNKLFILLAAAFLLATPTSIFTSCSDGDDAVVDNPGGGSGNEGGQGDALDLNGTYDANTLKMSYNGEELTGKRVAFTADDKLEKATIVLSGVENNIGDMLSGLLGEIKLTTNSPIPGEKEITLENVELTPNADGTAYLFEGEDRNATRTMTYKGTVKEGEMNIVITNALANQSLAGTWEMGPLKYSIVEGIMAPLASPLWIDWDTDLDIDAGSIEGVEFNMPPASLFSWVFSLGDSRFLPAFGIQGVNIDLKIQEWFKNLLQSVTAESNGCMFATYSYSGDLANPAWSSEMSHNIIRYYYGEEGAIYVEANADFILNAISGLIAGGLTRADEQTIAEIVKPLVDALKPALENGFKCQYAVTGDKMKINLDGKFTQTVLKEVVTILNNPTIYPLIMDAIENDATLATYKVNIEKLLASLPDALAYKDRSHTQECQYVKIGLQLVKGAE